MSFHLSCADICVRGHTLHARLNNSAGEPIDAEMNLDSVLGNNDGHFDWSSEGFSHSASNIHVAIEGGEGVPVLRARLRRRDGSERDADVNLAERIANIDGRFVKN